MDGKYITQGPSAGSTAGKRNAGDQHVYTALCEVKMEDDIVDADTCVQDTSDVKCKYCDFMHSQIIYVITHEILLHGERIYSGLTNGQGRSDILSRYMPLVDSSYTCNLCDEKVKCPERRLSHLTCHIIPRELACIYCTFSHNSKPAINKHIAGHKYNKKHFLDKVISAKDCASTIAKTCEENVMVSDELDNTNQALEKASTSASKVFPDALSLLSDEGVCKYCDYKHHHFIYVITHEVMVHADIICDELKVEKSRGTVSRFIHPGLSPGGFACFICLLCMAKLNQAGRVSHLNNHITQSDVKCDICTYCVAAGKSLGRHMRCHKTCDKIILDLIKMAKQCFMSGEPLSTNIESGSTWYGTDVERCPAKHFPVVHYTANSDK